MKQTFKPLALAAAVAALSAGTVGVVNAQSQPAGVYPSMGSAAFVPYYTVQGDWVTGVHITNTSDQTQVIKMRLRRAEDSKDILDFNLILSPYDMWTGTVRGDDSAMEIVTEDKSCTAPSLVGGTTAPVRAENLEGAQEGYIEIIGMAQADSSQPISKAALHVNGTPVSCAAVQSNFLADNVVANDETDGTGGSSVYSPTTDALKVSYFIRDNASGIEFGNNAVHFTGYSNGYAMMTHQQYGVESYGSKGEDALNGWDFPDVRGGGLNTGNADDRTVFQDVVRPELGAENIINDWSYNPATGASVDWTVTFPGQYAMIDYWNLQIADVDPNATWDYREIPVVAKFVVYDREEGQGVPGGLDFSPSPAPDTALLPYEVNVVTWGPDGDVLDSVMSINVDPAQAGITSPVGWATLAVSGTVKKERVQQGVGDPVPFSVCDLASGPESEGGDGCTSNGVEGTPVPMVGFAAWDRTFENPDKNYGRIVEHSFTVSQN